MLFDRWRSRHDDDQTPVYDDTALAVHQAEMIAWEVRRDALAAALSAAESFAGLDDLDGIDLAPGERVLLEADRATLIQARTAPGDWEPATTGVSVPLGVIDGVPMRFLAGHGHAEYLPGTPVPQVVDTGTLWITTTRVLFLGDDTTQQVDLADLAGVSYEQVHGMVRLTPSGARRPLVLAVGSEGIGAVNARLDLALADLAGTRADLVAALRERLWAHEAARPVLHTIPAEDEALDGSDLEGDTPILEAEAGEDAQPAPLEPVEPAPGPIHPG